MPYATKEQKATYDRKRREQDPKGHRERKRRHYEANKLQYKNRELFWRYGISLERYDEMLQEQGGGCAACGTLPSDDLPWLHVDHDHRCCSSGRSCGKCVMGLLCDQCNRAAGILGDSADRAYDLAKYLERSRGSGHTGPNL